MMNEKELKELLKSSEGDRLEFKRGLNSSISRDICAFANASGGDIILGVADDSEIIGYKLTNRVRSSIQDHARKMEPPLSVEVEQVGKLAVIHVPEGKDKPYFAGGHLYLRIGSSSQRLNRDEIREFFQKEGKIVFDEKYADFQLDDISEEAYERFLEKAGISKVLSREQILMNLGFYKDGQMNYAGILLFSKDITRYLRNAVVTCVLYMGTGSTIIDKKEFNGDLVGNFEDAIKHIKSKLNTEYVIGGMYREEYLELPEKALREGLINAMVHRDYFSNAPILINIYIDSIRILNPVRMNMSLSLDDLLKGSYPANPFLFGNLERIDLVEKAGSGFTRIREAMDGYSLPFPEVRFSERLFEIAFARPDLQRNSYRARVIEGKGDGGAEEILPAEEQETRVKTGGETRRETGVKNDEIIIRTMTENPEITREELAETTGLTVKGVDWNIKKLKDENKIRRVGPDKGGHWEVGEEPLADGKKTRVKTGVKTRVKTGVKTDEIIIQAMIENPEITREELAETTGLTVKGVDWNIKKLKGENKIKRVGPDKGGHWEVVE